MKLAQLNLLVTSHLTGDSNVDTKLFLSGGGEPVGSSTTEKVVLSDDSTSGGVRL